MLIDKKEEDCTIQELIDVVIRLRKRRIDFSYCICSCCGVEIRTMTAEIDEITAEIRKRLQALEIFPKD